MLAEIETRLDAEVADLKLVAGAAEFAALKTNPPKSKQPAAYVVPLSDRAGRNTRINAVAQQVTARVAVVLALGNLGDRRGDSASKTIETLRGDVRAALLGWAPTAADDPMEYVAGRVLALRDGVVWWQDEFRTTSLISAT